MAMRPRRFLAWTALALGACGQGDAPAPPAASMVEFQWSPPAGACVTNSCSTGCAHNLAPALDSLPSLTTLWDSRSWRMTAAGPGRWRILIQDVPADVPVRVTVLDLAGCCSDPCAFGIIARDVFANGTPLSRLVHEGLPPNVPSAVEFVLTSDGRIVP